MFDRFPDPSAGRLYLTEGGTETEILYKYGYEFPHFAVFEVLNDPEGKRQLEAMFAGYLDAAAEHGWSVLMGGLDYRASPDWGRLLGYSREGLREMQIQCIEFLRDVARPYAGQIDEIRIAGIVGPRGDAYSLNRTITAEEAEDYHAQQLETLTELGVDMAWGATFNNVPEAVGLARAAARAEVPLCMSFTLSSDHRLQSGPTLKQAIETVDSEAGDHKPACYGINCSHPLEFEPALEPGDWFGRVRSIRPNAAAADKISLCKLGHLEDGDPVDLGRQLGALAARYPHIDIWGGCCGTWDRHLGEIARSVSAARG